jgi:hypothetical protein
VITRRIFVALLALAGALCAGAAIADPQSLAVSPDSGVGSAAAIAAAAPAATPAPTAVSAAAPATTDSPAVDAANQAVAAVSTSNRKVSIGSAYGANLFAGLAVGALLGCAGAAIPYAYERHNQSPQNVVYGAAYGGLGGVVALGIPVSAWEVASNRPGAGIDVLYNTLAFAVMGGAVGAGGGMISYSRTQSYAPDAGENFLAASAAGVCAGALVGIVVGVVDAGWQGPAARIPGKGIHASVGLLAFSMLHDDGHTVYALPNATLARMEF